MRRLLPLLVLTGCFERLHTPPTVGPGEDCFSLLELPRPDLPDPDRTEDLSPLVGAAVWCGAHPERDLPPLPAPRVAAACAVTLGPADGRWTEEQRWTRDADGRLVSARVGRLAATWTYADGELAQYTAVRGGAVVERRAYEDGRLVLREVPGITEYFLHDADGALVEHVVARADPDATEPLAWTAFDAATGAPVRQVGWRADGTTRQARWRFDAEAGVFRQGGHVTRCSSRGEPLPEIGRLDAAGHVASLLESRPDCLRRTDRARDATGALLRERVVCVGGDAVRDDRYARDGDGRLLCSDRRYPRQAAVFDWPPLRELDVPPTGCLGACAFEGVRPLKGKLPRARAFIDRDDTGLPVWMELDADVNGVIDGVIDLTPTYDAEGRLVVERFLGPSVVMEARYAYDCAAGE